MGLKGVPVQMEFSVLLVDDEREFVQGMKANLEREGHRVIAAYDGSEALEAFASHPIDLVLLDLMLPEVDGMEVCRRLRRESTIPIIMLTARDDDIDKILGLEVGADDYLTKPFNFRELLARIRAIMRRVQADKGEHEQSRTPIAPGITLDLHRQALLSGECEVALTVKEFSLLQMLARNRGRVFSREELLDRVWGYDYYGSSRTVDVHIRRVRKKLQELPGATDGSDILKTRWGAGYFLEETVS